MGHRRQAGREASKHRTFKKVHQLPLILFVLKLHILVQFPKKQHVIKDLKGALRCSACGKEMVRSFSRRTRLPLRATHPCGQPWWGDGGGAGPPRGELNWAGSLKAALH